VRGLAGRSAAAAKEIKELIGESLSKVDTGTRLVRDAGTTMSGIVGEVKRVNDIIGEISATAVQQSAEVEQVNSAVTQLDRMTQQNAALVEQATAASESLTAQSQRLASVVGSFKLEEGETVALTEPRETLDPVDTALAAS
jgi:methyl-accepting chemotaxis protein